MACDSHALARLNPVLMTEDLQRVWLIPGVYKKPGVKLNLRMLGFLSELRKKVDFDLVVNSGIRSPADQARAMAQDYAFHVYQGYQAGRQMVNELTASGPRPSAAEMTAVLERQVADGRFLSRHMRGDALDFRIHGLTGAERSQLLSVTREMVGQDAPGRWNAIDEGDHIHVEELGEHWAKYVMLGAGVLTVGTGVLTLAGLGAMWYFRDDLMDWLERR